MPEQEVITNIGSKASNCILLTITVICIGILVVCGVMVVREYSLGRSYSTTTCRIANISYAPEDSTCMFCATKEKGKKEKGAGSCIPSSFPCLRIKVVYTVKQQEYEGVLHPDSLQAASIDSQCSYSVCLKLPADNKAAVIDYANKWWNARDKSFPCFYDKSDFNRVIAHKMHSTAEVIHIMFWPSLVIVICGLVFLRLEMNRRGLAFCPTGSKTPPDDQPYQHVDATRATNNGAKNQHDGHAKHNRKLIHDYPPKYSSTLSGSLPTLDRPQKGDKKRLLHVPGGAGTKLSSSQSHETLRQKNDSPKDTKKDQRRLSYTSPCGANAMSRVETPV